MGFQVCLLILRLSALLRQDCDELMFSDRFYPGNSWSCGFIFPSKQLRVGTFSIVCSPSVCNIRCFYFTKKSFITFLMLAGDIELNPGPNASNYSINTRTNSHKQLSTSSLSPPAAFMNDTARAITNKPQRLHPRVLNDKSKRNNNIDVTLTSTITVLS